MYCNLLTGKDMIVNDEVRNIIDTIENYSVLTAGHSLRVMEMAYAFGKALHLSSARLTDLCIAAAVHDIGKLKVPTEVLDKPGQLTPDEVTVMRKHATFTEEMLTELGFDEKIVRIASGHHERPDGQGYPHQLKGNQVLLEDLILNLCDSVDAMLSRRQYKNPLPSAKVMKIVEKDCGTQFNSYLGHFMLRHWDVITGARLYVDDPTQAEPQQ